MPRGKEEEQETNVNVNYYKEWPKHAQIIQQYTSILILLPIIGKQNLIFGNENCFEKSRLLLLYICKN